MPLQDFQKEYIVRQSGYDPAKYTTDDEGNTIIPKPPVAISPSVSSEIQQPSAIKPTPDGYTPFQSAKIAFGAGAAPAIGAGAGAGLGATVGSAFGPVGTFGGAVVGGGIGALMLNATQDVLMPEEWERIIAASAAENPKSAMAGQIATIPLSGFSPTTPGRLMSGLGAIPKLATGLRPTAAEAGNLLNLGIGASLPPIQQVASSAVSGQPMPSVGQLGQEVLLGALFSRPNAIGKMYGFHDIVPKDIQQQLQGELVPRVESEQTAPSIQAVPPQQSITPLSTINAVTPTMGTWTAGSGKTPERYVPYKTAEESAQTILQGGNVVPREAAYEAAQQGQLSNYQLEQLVRSKSYTEALAQQAEQQRLEALQAKAELDRQEAANLQSENAARALELQQSMGPKFGSEIRTTPLATTEMGRDIMPDYTGVKEQANREVAAESPADLAAREAEARMAGEAKPKYSEGSELPTRTKLQEEVLPEAKQYEPTKRWFDLLNEHIFKMTGIKVDMSGNVINEKGEPVAGQSLVNAFQKGIKLNTSKMGADTPVHELYHAFVELLRQSNRAADKRMLLKYDRAVESSPDYLRWKGERDAKGLSSTPEEYQATNAGYEFIKRHLNLDKEGAFAKWKGDFGAYIKTRFGKHGTVEDFQRLLNYKLIHDKPLGDISGIGAQAAKSSDESELPTASSYRAQWNKDKERLDSIRNTVRGLVSSGQSIQDHPIQRERTAIHDKYKDGKFPESPHIDEQLRRGLIIANEQKIKGLNEEDILRVLRHNSQGYHPDIHDALMNSKSVDEVTDKLGYQRIGGKGTGYYVDVVKKGEMPSWYKPGEFGNGGDSDGIRYSESSELRPSEDKQQYDTLVGQMREALTKRDFDKFYELQKQTEAIKNRHEGMPPKYSEESETGKKKSLLGNVDSYGAVNAVESNFGYHNQHGLDHGSRWRYDRIRNEVKWIDSPSAEDKSAVESFLLKKGIKPSGHTNYFRNEKYQDESELTPEGKFPYSHASVKETLDEHIKALRAGKYDEDGDLSPEEIQGELASIKNLFRNEVDWKQHKDVASLIDEADFGSLPQMRQLESILKNLSPETYADKPIEQKAIEAKPAEIPTPVVEKAPVEEKPVKATKQPEVETPEKYPIVDIENTWRNPEPLTGQSKEQFIAQLRNEYAAIDKLRSKAQAIGIMERIKEGLLRNVKYRSDNSRTTPEIFRAESRANILLAQYEHLKNRWGVSDHEIEQLGRDSTIFNWPKPKNVAEAEKTADIQNLPLAKKGSPKIGLESVTENPLWKELGFDTPEDFQATIDKVRKQRELEKAQEQHDSARSYNETLGKYPRKVVKELLGDEAPPKPRLGQYSEESELPYKRASFIPALTGRIDKIAEHIQTPEARYVVDNLHRFSGEADRLNGQIGNKLIGSLEPLKPAQVEKVYKYLYDVDNSGRSLVRLNSDEKKVADRIVEILREPRKQQIALGLKVSTGKGNYRQAGIKPEGYMFNMLDPKVAYTWAEHRTSPETKAYDEAYVKHQISKGSTREDALERLHEYKIALGSMVKGGDVDFNALRRAEGNGLPWELADKNFASAASRYSKRAARDLAFFKYVENDPKMRYLLNVKDQFGNWEPKEKWQKELGAPIGTDSAVQQAMRSVYGIDMPRNPRIMSGARLAANLVMGPGTAARNLANMGSFIAQYVQVPQLPLVFKAIAGMNEARVRAFENNAIRAQFSDYDLAGFYEGNPNPAINLMNKASAMLRKYQGRDFSDKIEGLVYYSLGEHLATDNIAAAKNGNKESLRFIKRFSDTVDGGYKKLLAGKIEKGDIEKIAKRFTDAARGTYGEEGLPSFAIEGEIAPFTALSRFAIEKSNTIWKDVVEPMREGIYGPFLRYVLASLGVGMGIEKINELFSNKRGPDPKISEIMASGNQKELVPKAISLLQLASFAGIVGDSMKLASNAAQGKSLRYNQPLSFPLYTLVTDTLAGNIADAAGALQEGENPFEVGVDLLTTIAKQSSQAYRYADANFINPKEAERKEKFRDLRIFNELEGNAEPAQAERSNELSNIGAKQFKRTDDLGKAMELLPDLIQRAFEKSGGNPEKLKRELQSLKQNNYQTMPSPDKMPMSFIRYLNYLSKTQGADAASKRFRDYIMQNKINQAKSELVPSL